MQSLHAVNVGVEQRVEEVEAGDPEGNRGAEQPRLPREMVRDRNPRADGASPSTTKPVMAEPGPSLQVGIDHEADNRNRPEPVRLRRQL